MQQIRKLAQTKKRLKPNAFISVNSTWCAIADVKITFPDDSENEVHAIYELLNGKTTNEFLE
jgi:hypothetical protein